MTTNYGKIATTIRLLNNFETTVVADGITTDILKADANTYVRDTSETHMRGGRNGKGKGKRGFV